MPNLDRRSFTAAAALAALAGKASAQTAPASALPPLPAESLTAIRANVARLAGDPFTRPLAFRRQDAAPKLRPFALADVRLGEGPFREMHAANASYLKRLSADRLLHSFRVNAGLTSNAQPLGGWEEPKGELRGHFLGHYLSACALGWAPNRCIDSCSILPTNSCRRCS